MVPWLTATLRKGLRLIFEQIEESCRVRPTCVQSRAWKEIVQRRLLPGLDFEGATGPPAGPAGRT